MSAEILHEAANLMRARAEAATPARGWNVDVLVVGNFHEEEDAGHIASWSPAVALAVADLIDWHATHDVGGPSWRLAHAAAGAYLGVGGAS